MLSKLSKKVLDEINLILGLINRRLVIGLVYIIVLLPITSVMCLIEYDPLRIKRNGEKTYRKKRKDHLTDLTHILNYGSISRFSQRHLGLH